MEGGRDRADNRAPKIQKRQSTCLKQLEPDSELQWSSWDMTNAQLTLASICNKGRMTDTLWFPRKDVSVIWSVPGTTRTVLLSVLETRVFYAQQDERLGHQPVFVKWMLKVPAIYLFSTCFPKQLLFCLSFSFQVSSSWTEMENWTNS